jgi:hypothetical protein
LATDIDTYITATILPGAWQAATLGNGWTNRGAGFPVMKYRKTDGNKNVQIVGQILPGTKTDNTVLFTLAAGFRPITQHAGLMVYAPLGSAGPEVFVDTTGTVSIQGIGAGATVLQVNVTFPLDL